MENFKLNTKLLCKISKLINKMGISSLIMKINVESGNDSADKQEVVKELLALIVDNLYKVEDEITDFIAELKGISKEEAENEDIIPIIQELMQNEKFKSFLKFA